MPGTLSPPPPLGKSALTPEVLAAMKEEERNFWNKLNELATKEIRWNQAARKKTPYAPSSKLQSLMLQAKSQYDGMNYCQMQQLSGIFTF